MYTFLYQSVSLAISITDWTNAGQSASNFGIPFLYLTRLVPTHPDFDSPFCFFPFSTFRFIENELFHGIFSRIFDFF